MPVASSLIRLVVGSAFALGLGVISVRAQSAVGGPKPALSAELEALLNSIPTWSISTAARASYGFKDNLLLSSSDEERSAFARGGFDFLLLRVPRGSFDFSVFAEVEGTHYFSARTSDEDSRIWFQTEPGYRLGETLKFSVPVTGFYYDQVFDVSDTDIERLVAELKVKGVMAAPTVRWDLHPAWWLEAQATGQRKRFDDRANDGRIGEGSLRLGWAPGSRFEARLSGGRRWRDFDRRTQYSSSGRELPDLKLKIAEREWEARVDFTWDRAERWQTTTRASLLDYQDNGSGYFNYREERVTQELEWRGGAWFVRVGGSAARLDFAVQKVGIGIDPPARLKDEFAADLLVERKLDERWTAYAAYAWERTRSNDAFASYRVNEGLLGVRWSWDK